MNEVKRQSLRSDRRNKREKRMWSLGLGRTGEAEYLRMKGIHGGNGAHVYSRLAIINEVKYCSLAQ